MHYQSINTPCGLLGVSASDTGISRVAFESNAQAQQPNALTALACEQLTAYFDKALCEFDLPLDANGTVFQHQVWHALTEIPYGKTASYADIAHRIGNPKAVRAVGGANGKNPIAIIVPCHRIIGSNNTLTGYAGGLERKDYLLTLEGGQKALWG